MNRESMFHANHGAFAISQPIQNELIRLIEIKEGWREPVAA
jgi:hypothetical protein